MCLFWVNCCVFSTQHSRQKKCIPVAGKLSEDPFISHLTVAISACCLSPSSICRLVFLFLKNNCQQSSANLVIKQNNSSHEDLNKASLEQKQGSETGTELQNKTRKFLLEILCVPDALCLIAKVMVPLLGKDYFQVPTETISF